MRCVCWPLFSSPLLRLPTSSLCDDPILLRALCSIVVVACSTRLSVLLGAASGLTPATSGATSHEKTLGCGDTDGVNSRKPDMLLLRSGVVISSSTAPSRSGSSALPRLPVPSSAEFAPSLPAEINDDLACCGTGKLPSRLSRRPVSVCGSPSWAVVVELRFRKAPKVGAAPPPPLLRRLPLLAGDERDRICLDDA